jgi:WD40 repeat protein
VVLLAARRHDPYLLSRTETPDGPTQRRFHLVRLLQQTEFPAPTKAATNSDSGPMEALGLSRLVGWMLAPLAMLRLRDTVLGQAVLRKESHLLAFFKKSVFGRVLRRLIHQRLLNQSDAVLLVMNDRRLLDTAAQPLPEKLGQTRQVTTDDDAQQLDRVLPLRPVWLSLVLVSALGLLGTLPVLGILAWLAPSSTRSWLVPYGIREGLVVCVFLAVWQHIPSLLLEFRVVSDPNPPHPPSGTLLSRPRQVAAFLRKLLFGSSQHLFPMLAGGLALAIVIVVHAYLRQALVDEPVTGADGLLFLVPPLLITNLLAPELIARCRGTALLYPDPSRRQLSRQRWGAVAGFAGCCVLVLGLCWLGTWASYPRWGKRLVLRGHTDTIHSVAFSPDGKYLASAGFDNQVKLWDVRTGREIGPGLACGGRAFSVVFNPDGKSLAACSGDHTIRFWEVPSGREVRTVVLSPFDRAWEVTYSPDGKFLLAAVTSDSLALGFLARPLSPLPLFSPRPVGNVVLYEAVTGRQVEAYPLVHWEGINSVAFSPDGRFFASGGPDGLVNIWDRERKVLVRSLAGHDGAVSEVAYARDGKWLGSAGADRSITIWDAHTGDKTCDLKGCDDAVEWIGFHPTQPILMSTGSDGMVWI